MLSFTGPATTPAEVTAYLQAAGATGWPTDEALQAQAIMRGQRYLAARYNARWLTQWPSDAAQAQVKFAIAEAALLEAVKPGSLSVVSNPLTDKILVQAGKLSWERVGGASAAHGLWPRSLIIEGLLAGLLGPEAGSTVWLARVLAPSVAENWRIWA